MQLPIEKSWISPFVLIVITSVTNCIIYVLCRFVDHKSKYLFIGFNVAIILMIALVIPDLTDQVTIGPFSYFTTALLLMSFFSGIIHLNSVGLLGDFICVFLMKISGFTAAFLIALCLHQLIYFKGHHIPMFVLNDKEKLFFQALLILQFLSPPFLFWMLKDFRLRPGIDKHFDD